MSNANMPAFPRVEKTLTKPMHSVLPEGWVIHEHVVTTGLSKREYFAAKALQGILANPNTNRIADAHARDATLLADALIEFLDRTRPQSSLVPEKEESPI